MRKQNECIFHLQYKCGVFKWYAELLTNRLSDIEYIDIQFYIIGIDWSTTSSYLGVRPFTIRINKKSEKPSGESVYYFEKPDEEGVLMAIEPQADFCHRQADEKIERKKTIENFLSYFAALWSFLIAAWPFSPAIQTDLQIYYSERHK